jgi:hypothetical protein
MDVLIVGFLLVLALCISAFAIERSALRGRRHKPVAFDQNEPL